MYDSTKYLIETKYKRELINEIVSKLHDRACKHENTSYKLLRLKYITDICEARQTEIPSFIILSTLNLLNNEILTYNIDDDVGKWSGTDIIELRDMANELERFVKD